MPKAFFSLIKRHNPQRYRLHRCITAQLSPLNCARYNRKVGQKECRSFRWSLLAINCAPPQDSARNHINMSDWKWSSATKEAEIDGWFAHMIRRRELKSRCSSLPIKHTHTHTDTLTYTQKLTHFHTRSYLQHLGCAGWPELSIGSSDWLRWLKRFSHCFNLQMMNHVLMRRKFV